MGWTVRTLALAAVGEKARGDGGALAHGGCRVGQAAEIRSGGRHTAQGLHATRLSQDIRRQCH